MIDFKECLEKDELITLHACYKKILAIKLMRKLAMGSKMKRFTGKGWNFHFYYLDEAKDDLCEIRFARVERLDWKHIRVNADGTCSLLLRMGVWVNKLLYEAHRNENATWVTLALNYTPGKKDSCDIERDLFAALRCAEEIRNHGRKGLTLEAQDNGTTLVTAPDNSFEEVSTPVIEKAQALIEKFGLNVISLDSDHITCAQGKQYYLNLHIDNPEVLNHENFEDFEEKRYALTEFASKYDWDVWFVNPGHSRNAFIEWLHGHN